ncbi:unnamed protein product [Urochloa humidicola]
MAESADEVAYDTRYASAVELDSIRRTLDQFMKKQEQSNDVLATALDKLAQSVDILGSKLGFGAPEEKGSYYKGKGQQVSNYPSTSRILKSQLIGQSSQLAQNHIYRPPHVRRAHFMHNFDDHNHWSTNGQVEGFDDNVEDEKYEDMHGEDNEWDVNPFWQEQQANKNQQPSLSTKLQPKHQTSNLSSTTTTSSSSSSYPTKCSWSEPIY